MSADNKDTKGKIEHLTHAIQSKVVVDTYKTGTVSAGVGNFTKSSPAMFNAGVPSSNRAEVDPSQNDSASLSSRAPNMHQ